MSWSYQMPLTSSWENKLQSFLCSHQPVAWSIVQLSIPLFLSVQLYQYVQSLVASLWSIHFTWNFSWYVFHVDNDCIKRLLALISQEFLSLLPFCWPWKYYQTLCDPLFCARANFHIPFLRNIFIFQFNLVHICCLEFLLL